MKTFTLYWLTGDREVVKGNTISDAFSRSGCGGGAIRALDFHANGDDNNYVWNSINHKWVKKEK